MKFLLDQDVYVLTERFLRGQRYDMVTASELGLSHAKDSNLLELARNRNAFSSNPTGIMAIWSLCITQEAV
jgi:predicted nuclease of predicted toxin-antitoxin system